APAPAPSAPALSRPAPPAAATSLDLSTPSSPPAPAVAAGSTSLDLSTPSRPAGGAAPTGSTSLDLTPARPAAPAAATGGTSLDLATPARPASAGSTSLDLSAAPAATPTAPARRRPSAAAGDLVLGYEPERLPPGGRATLTDDRPTLTLDRLQSGVGVLTLRTAVSDHVGDLRLAAAYTLTTGESSVLDPARGLTSGPVGAARPVLVAGADVVRVDLRRVRSLERLVVLAYSASGAELRWGGALLVETAGGARVDVPLDREPAAGVLVALSVTAVAGELVLRAEDELVHGAVRDACQAYGFGRITWVDPWTPLT
ncbi:hypothetical protein HLB10_16445, partial [Cellulomonas fimi]|nr:hypothetical protein [Cellulomonas fimi]